MTSIYICILVAFVSAVIALRYKNKSQRDAISEKTLLSTKHKNVRCSDCRYFCPDNGGECARLVRFRRRARQYLLIIPDQLSRCSLHATKLSKWKGGK